MVFFISVRIVISLLVLCIVAITAITLWVTPARDIQKKQQYSSPDLTKMDEYVSTNHNFTISYPLPNEIIEYSPDAFSIGTMSGQTVISVANMRIFQKPTTREIEEFVVEQAKNICTADSPDDSVSCTKVQKNQPINTDSGIQGVELYLQEEHTNLATNELIETYSKGPFFAFPLSSEKVILVYAPTGDIQHTVDYWAIRIIAESLKLAR